MRAFGLLVVCMGEDDDRSLNGRFVNTGELGAE